MFTNTQLVGVRQVLAETAASAHATSHQGGAVFEIAGVGSSVSAVADRGQELGVVEN